MKRYESVPKNEDKNTKNVLLCPNVLTRIISKYKPIKNAKAKTEKLFLKITERQSITTRASGKVVMAPKITEATTINIKKSHILLPLNNNKDNRKPVKIKETF